MLSGRQSVNMLTQAYPRLTGFLSSRRIIRKTLIICLDYEYSAFQVECSFPWRVSSTFLSIV